MHTRETWRLGRRPALDGLRGVASHGIGWFGIAGAVGVTVFFTLSGFLITSLLVEVHADHGRICLRAFYNRRLRRLGPALLVFLAVVLVVDTVNPYIGSPRWVAATLLYVTNWGMVGGGLPEGLAHTWSLSIEEQFYILFPLSLVVLVRKPRALLAVTAIACAASLALRLGMWVTGVGFQRIYFGADTNACALLAGAVLALSLHGRRTRTVRAHAAVAVALVALVALACVPAGTGVNSRVLVPIGTVAVTSALVAWLVRSHYSGLLTQRWLVRVGRRSYAWYLWHLPLNARRLAVRPGTEMGSGARHGRSVLPDRGVVVAFRRGAVAASEALRAPL